MSHLTPAAPGEHYARTDSGELIGPYSTVEECERERLAANAERRDLRTWKVVFANGEECYPQATHTDDAKHAARMLQDAQDRPVGDVPVIFCEPYGESCEGRR